MTRTRQRNPKEIENEILSKLDIAREYANLGLKFTTDKPTGKNWLSCHAFGREDRTASAAVQLDIGVYKDQGGSGECCGLFDFAVRSGKFPDYREARKHFATIVGLEKTLPDSDKEEKRLEEKIAIQSIWNGFMVRKLIALYPGVTEESLRRADAKLCVWPKSSKRPHHCVAVPAYGPYLVDAPPVGYVLMATSGERIKPSRSSDPQKRFTTGTTGLINRRGVSMIADGRAELIIKVEGFTDCMTWQARLCETENEKYLDRIAIVSNACGANETGFPELIAPVFAGIPTVVFHDADTPGQNGAAFWVQEISKYSSAINLQLPYTIEPSHGKDSRDWSNEGNNVRELLEMIRKQFPGFLAAFDGVQDETGESKNGTHGNNGNGASHSGNGAIPQNRIAAVTGNGTAGEVRPVLPAGHGVEEAKPAETLTQYQFILKKLGMIVMGMPEGTNNVAAFCERTGRTFILERISSLKMTDLVLHLGPEIVKCIQNGSADDDPTKLSMSSVQLAIAAEGSKTRLTGKGYFGVGIWELGGRLLIVNAGEATIVNGEITRTSVPIVDGKIFDFGESKKWFDHDWFVEEFARTADREYSMSVLNEAIEIFSRWDNWSHSHNSEIVASLICCSWIQTVWDYRPQACVVGGSNSGKSTLFTVTKGMFCQGRMTVGGADPTMAWIRQSLGNSAKIIQCDEFEHAQRRKECLDGFRASSRGETVGRGTSGQRGISFTLRHLPWHGAISADFRSAADRNRYLMLELNPVPKGRGSTLLVPSPEECEQLGLKLMVIAVRHWQRAKSIAATVKKVYFDGVDRRVVESFSVPCSMIAAILGLSDAESVELVKDMLSERNFEEQSESDEQSLLRDIYESPVMLEGSKKTTMSMLIKGTHGDSHNDAMVRCGIRKILKNRVEYLFFCESSICSNLFTDPHKKSIGVCQILARVAGAIRDRQRMGAHNPRGVSIPLATINELLGVAEGSEDADFDEIGRGDRAEITGLEF